MSGTLIKLCKLALSCGGVIWDAKSFPQNDPILDLIDPQLNSTLQQARELNIPEYTATISIESVHDDSTITLTCPVDKLDDKIIHRKFVWSFTKVGRLLDYIERNKIENCQ